MNKVESILAAHADNTHKIGMLAERIRTSSMSNKLQLLMDLGAIQESVNAYAQNAANAIQRAAAVEKVNAEIVIAEKERGEVFYRFAKMQEQQFNAAVDGTSFAKFLKCKIRRLVGLTAFKRQAL